MRLGDKVQVAHGSGVDSGQTGEVISQFQVRFDGRGIPELEGEYKPWDSKRMRDECFVRLDSTGRIISMFKNRLIKETK